MASDGHRQKRRSNITRVSSVIARVACLLEPLHRKAAGDMSYTESKRIAVSRLRR
jgi:hypothetical protein